MALAFSHAEHLLLQRGWVLILFKSKNILGQDSFAYVLTLDAQIRHLEKTITDKPFIDLTQYGHTVHSGVGIPGDMDRQKAENACNHIFYNS